MSVSFRKCSKSMPSIVECLAISSSASAGMTARLGPRDATSTSMYRRTSVRSEKSSRMAAVPNASRSRTESMTVEAISLDGLLKACLLQCRASAGPFLLPRGCCARAREVHTLECRSWADGHQGHSGSTEEIMGATMTAATAPPPKPFYRHLYVQVLPAIIIGVLLGHFYPDL